MHIGMLVFLYFLVYPEIAFVEKEKSCEAQSIEIAQKVIYEHIYVWWFVQCIFKQEIIPDKSEEVAEAKED